MKTVGRENTQNKAPDSCFTNFCELFKYQVQKNPTAVAAIFEEKSITYAELDDRSQNLANFLIASGVKPNTIIALCLTNSLDLLIAILGIFQSGGAYLPIDPHYPPERIKSMLSDAQPAILIAEEGTKDQFASSPYKIILMNEIPSLEPMNQTETIQPDHLAYVVYTSGSTGKPKGILVDHRALSHAALAYRTLHPDRLISLMSGSISFDASLLVIAHTLSSGGIVCVPESNGIVDPEKIVTLIEKHAINYTLCVPSFYAMLLNKARELPSLQSVDLGGDNIPAALPEIHAKLAPNALLYNVYGPSEYAVGATYAKIYDPKLKQRNKITIGKPLDNTQVYILDEQLQQVPTGTKGEIFIAGSGLARGYLHREALTAEKFIYLALPNQGTIRFYRTGDFGRFLPDGNIEFYGRIDQQVKIRGYRVELGEIEHAICQYPEVNEAVVAVREDPDGNKRLAVYFSSITQKQIANEVRAYLSNVLPKSIVPSAFMQIDMWPLSPNGKIDRAALPSIPEPQTATPMDRNLPLSELEQEIFQIWKSVLKQDTFSVEDNFFDIGGDSLQVAEIQTLLQNRLGLTVEMVQLFQFPTISQLARHLQPNEKIDKTGELQQRALLEKRKSAFQRFKKNQGELQDG